MTRAAAHIGREGVRAEIELVDEAIPALNVDFVRVGDRKNEQIAALHALFRAVDRVFHDAAYYELDLEVIVAVERHGTTVPGLFFIDG